jgi:putative transposase
MGNRENLAVDSFYHIYNRGTEKRKIFLGEKDYSRFLVSLFLCNSKNPVDLKLQGSTLYELLKNERGETIVDICAYCLMPNHFHLLLREKTDGGISKFMQKLQTAYTMYFNKKSERTGALFQGRFKLSIAATDNYLKYLVAYIHLNPVKLIEPEWKEIGIKNKTAAIKFLKEYRYSSYAEFLGTKREENKIVNIKALPDYFEKPIDFESTIKDWLEYKAA